ncbi:MAG: ABC transporter permease [Thermoanaerobaculia bacterium]
MKQESAARRFIVAAIALSAAAAALVGLALLAGASPIDALRSLAEGSVGSRAALGETLARATALVLTAIAASLAFRAGVLNIGLEGQFLAGAVAAAAVGPLLSGAPFVARAGLLVASALAGALWVLPAAYLEARRGVPEVLSTILLNLIAAAAVSGLVRGALQDPRGDYPQSRALPDAVRLAPLVSGSRATAAIVAALALALLVTLALEATPLGLKLRATGLAPAAARTIGLPAARLRLLAFSASGALATIVPGVLVLAVLAARARLARKAA